MKDQKIIKELKDANHKIKENKRFSFLTWFDIFKSYFRYGSSPKDYFRYEFFKKSSLERNTFLTYKKSQKVLKQFNDEEFSRVAKKKNEFLDFFNPYLKRNWLDLSNAGEDELVRFINNHEAFFMKEISSGQGRNVRFGYAQEVNKEGALNFLNQFRNYVIEEPIFQHQNINKFHPFSVNTIRVYTVFDASVNEPYLISAVIRMGNNESSVDNSSAGGIMAQIDLEKGIVFTPGVDKNLNKFLSHPLTEQQIVGLQIPNWGKVLQLSRELHHEIPQLKLLGWDLAILENDVDIIEVNHDPCHFVMQGADQKGKYPQIKKHLRLI